MKKGKMIWLAVIAALVLAPTLCWAEMYVEGYIGGVAASSSSGGVSVNGTNVPGFEGRYDNPFILGGLKVGTWFVKEGFLGYDYPDWMKYLGFHLDFSYHRLNFSRQLITGTGVTIESEGYAATLAFMFTGRYGFLPDQDVPFGRLQPYISVGPGILFSGQKATAGTGAASIDTPSNSTTDIALVVDAGVRYYALKNVSLDAFYRFRWAEPKYNYTVLGNTLDVKPDYQLHSFQIGVAYHF
ncbi:MAG TPA: hypothetical protein DCY27_02740 [Desulfobacterales bacterium]|nr:hypothetical protein [Desulfobacterales bacterium]